LFLKKREYSYIFYTFSYLKDFSKKKMFFLVFFVGVLVCFLVFWFFGVFCWCFGVFFGFLVFWCLVFLCFGVY